MKNKFLIAILSLFAAVAGVFSVGQASWAYTANQANDNYSITAKVPEWQFHDPLPIEPGQTIEIDDNGNVTINGETVEAEIDTDGQDTYDNGDVSIKVGVDEDGNLVLTEFTTSNSSFWAVFGSDIYLPTAITIDGASYPITGISEALDIELTSAWIGTNTIHIPEGYTYICDGAFASITAKATFELPSTLVSIGSGAFMPARNVTQTINYAGTQAEWNAIDKASNYENGRGSLTINYNS